jgi:DNA polymerase delta subunit 3
LAVTKEEPAWESFSEDEPVIKAKPTTSSGPSGTKSKKSAGKPGQGNIMSFFAKKT